MVPFNTPPHYPEDEEEEVYLPNSPPIEFVENPSDDGDYCTLYKTHSSLIIEIHGYYRCGNDV